MKSKNDKDGGNFKREKDASNLEEKGYYSYYVYIYIMLLLFHTHHT